MKRFFCLAITGLLVTTIITGCGWRLRGTGTVENVSSVHISSQGRFGSFYEALSRSLQASDIEVVENATDAQYNIVILDQKYSRRTASVSVTVRVSEYQLTEEVTIMILASDGRPLLQRTTLSTDRFFDFDENDVQSKEDEANLLRREMQSDLIRQIISRLDAVANRSTTSPPNAPEG
ncbi:LPS-assembly lipoprotein LptE [Porticoccus sp.]|uniref:LPS-assembly lipoprotein LptE n=1 Tax=Porticoccus sp. TaxID=2024853 RepID=UPI003F69BFF1